MNMKGGLGNIMKQAQVMQEKMQQAQEELAQTEVEGSSGGGLVTITMTCRHDVRKISIDDELLSEEKAVLEDLVAAAVNDAVRKVELTTQEKMSGMTAGLGLPSGMNLPF
ncbi:MAG: YbaB/EbfC family nucleoid-associated protein [Gammaproteobacteria bacterium]|nr:YbaB/EbfC family nucleoid-associated protein [Gammaproteobacteria bacterium]